MVTISQLSRFRDNLGFGSFLMFGALKCVITSAMFRIALILCLTTAGVASAMPSKVILIRHAEKPKDKDDIHLNEKGYARAKALPSFFEKYEKGALLKLFAQGQKHSDSSLRPIETLIPTSKKFGIEINHQFVKNESNEMVDYLESSRALDRKTVVVSWGHDELGNISSRLGKNMGEWSSSVFDRAWVYEFDTNGKLKKFSDVPQKLLPGDSQE